MKVVEDREAATLKRKTNEQLGECLHLYIACMSVQDLLDSYQLWNAN